MIGYVVGNTPHPFRGVYDGNDKNIYGLYVDTKNEDAGLFGNVGKGGVIRKVHVVDCYVHNDALYAGGIVGDNSSKISYCYSNCDVLGAQKVGGITGGQNGGTVVNCYFRGYAYANDITRAYAGALRVRTMATAPSTTATVTA